MSDWPVVGVAGARGVVGGAFLSILANAGLPVAALRAFGSAEGSAGYGDGSVPTRPLDEAAAAELDVLFLATDGATSRQIVEGPGRAVPLIVDNSSAFRLDPQVPLVVPEANGHAIGRREGNLIANPNCTTAAAVVALAPIRDLAGLESVDLASYQAVSGAGRAALDAYEAERAGGGTSQAEGSPFHGRIADNVVPQIDVLDDDGWSGEERKIIAELRKILELPDLDISATAVRVAGPHRPLGCAARADEPRGPVEGGHGSAGCRSRAGIPARHWQQSSSDAARCRRPRSRPGRPSAIHPGAPARTGAVPELG